MTRPAPSCFHRQLGLSIVAAIIAVISAGPSSANAPQRDQNETQGRHKGSAVILAFRRTNHIFVVRHGIPVKKFRISRKNGLNGLPLGVYHVLRERPNFKHKRWRFVRTFHRSRIAWSGRPLIADAPVHKIAETGGIVLPADVAERVLDKIDPGAALIVTDHISDPTVFNDIGLIEVLGSASDAKKQNPWSVKQTLEPAWQIDKPTAIIISEADRAVYVFRADRLEEKYVARVRYPHVGTGRHVYVLLGRARETEDLRWLAISISGGSYVKAPPAVRADDTLNRFSIEPEVEKRLRAQLHIGATLVVVDNSVRDFVRNDDLVVLMRSRRGQ